MRRGYPNLPAVKSQFWLGRMEWNYSPSKSKREVVHQRDEFWLMGNAKSLGSFDAMFKLSNAEPLLARETTYFLSVLPGSHQFRVRSARLLRDR